MNSRSKPKQFPEMHGKQIIIYTFRDFEYHDEVARLPEKNKDIYNRVLAKGLDGFTPAF